MLTPSRRAPFAGIEISVLIVRSVDAARRPNAAWVRELDGFGVPLGDVDLGFEVEV